MLSHDLRNYLSPATLRLHNVRRRAEQRRARGATYTTSTARSPSLDRVAVLVTDLLDTARLDSGFLQLSLEPVDSARCSCRRPRASCRRRTTRWW